MKSFYKYSKNQLKRTFCFLFVFLNYIFFINSENIKYTGSKNYIYVERTDLRRYDNGKYAGLLSREVKAYITPVFSENDFLYDGNFYVNQDTRRGISFVENGIHQAIPSSFKIFENGNFEMIEDYGYPSFRSFPSFPVKNIEIGESWEAESERAVDPLNKGIFTRMPIYIQYTYLRDEIFKEEPVYLFSAKWATRYGNNEKNIDLNGDTEIKSASGNHNATIYVSKNTGKVIVVRDSVDEIFKYKDGNNISFKGTISLFTEYPPQIDEEQIIPIIEKVDDVDIEKTEAGLKLILTNLQFYPDSSELLPGESVRLSDIAEILKKLPESQFLVEGHTASTGNLTGEMQLSVERAYKIVNELVVRGVAADRFIYKGYGSSRPISDNQTAEGKAKNRRVEITILE